mmetsp:Transcript_24823/g.56354  ORF Transcript_24823/g.56354 Transcript_24823/m.56354 type:complete len:88 (+) Transcript_24823:710-973(+)
MELEWVLVSDAAMQLSKPTICRLLQDPCRLHVLLLASLIGCDVVLLSAVQNAGVSVEAPQAAVTADSLVFSSQSWVQVLMVLSVQSG